MLPSLYTGLKNVKLKNELAACSGKIRYPSEELAWWVFYTYYFPFGKRGKGIRCAMPYLSCYFCIHCKGWHMGKSRWETDRPKTNKGTKPLLRFRPYRD
ncbi:hypothetical protein [Anditalea andensis]|uniref:Uncharacterized protein n=1 Tax=Anditalea andensis TaxID=1048983 RepID=A0A074KNW1_9BACT|nr:hypothetical protein [Anditalea andensis]KEO71596.1 hypothetical protein EL17_24105 [Anditalea andensis]